MWAWLIHAIHTWRLSMVCNYTWTWTYMWCPGDSFEPDYAAIWWKLQSGELGGEPPFPFCPGLVLSVATLEADPLLRITHIHTSAGLAYPYVFEYLMKSSYFETAPYWTIGGEGEGQRLWQTFHHSNDKWVILTAVGFVLFFKLQYCYEAWLYWHFLYIFLLLSEDLADLCMMLNTQFDSLIFLN